MNIKNRKKALNKIAEEQKEKALITKAAQVAQATSSSPEEYAQNFLKKLLEETDIHLIGEDDIT